MSVSPPFSHKNLLARFDHIILIKLLETVNRKLFNYPLISLSRVMTIPTPGVWGLQSHGDVIVSSRRAAPSHLGSQEVIFCQILSPVLKYFFLTWNSKSMAWPVLTLSTKKHSSYPAATSRVICLWRDLACAQGVKLRPKTIKRRFLTALMPHAISSFWLHWGHNTVLWCWAAFTCWYVTPGLANTLCHDITQAGAGHAALCGSPSVQSRLHQMW